MEDSDDEEEGKKKKGAKKFGDKPGFFEPGGTFGAAPDPEVVQARRFRVNPEPGKSRLRSPCAPSYVIAAAASLLSSESPTPAPTHPLIHPPAAPYPQAFSMRPYRLRVFLYQAVNIPATDSTGSSDPFCVVRCGKSCARSQARGPPGHSRLPRSPLCAPSRSFLSPASPQPRARRSTPLYAATRQGLHPD